MTEYELDVTDALFYIEDKVDLLTVRAEETLSVLGNIEGLMTFFVVVLLCFFVYKFFRMFF